MELGPADRNLVIAASQKVIELTRLQILNALQNKNLVTEGIGEGTLPEPRT
jgi:hypothetical protein